MSSTTTPKQVGYYSPCSGVRDWCDRCGKRQEIRHSVGGGDPASPDALHDYCQPCFEALFPAGVAAEVHCRGGVE